MSGNDYSFIKEMVEIFRDQIMEYTQQMPELNEKKDYENLSKVAHKAKSSVAVMGMSKEAELLKEIELKARAGKETGNFAEMIDEFIKSAGLALEELAEYLK